MYVVTYDNGSGYREWASTPQPTEELAWQQSGFNEGKLWEGSDPVLERVIDNDTKETVFVSDKPGK